MVGTVICHLTGLQDRGYLRFEKMGVQAVERLLGEGACHASRIGKEKHHPMRRICCVFAVFLPRLNFLWCPYYISKSYSFYLFNLVLL